MIGTKTRNALAAALLGTNALSKDEQRKRAAWEKASLVPGQDPNIVRSDCDFRDIQWNEYGQRSDFGWEIDHIEPSAIGGPDILSNLRARHWRGNRSVGACLGNALTLAGISGWPR